MTYPLENSIHFVMQSKGGVGKSVVSTLMSQYLLKNANDVSLIDIDPSNKTLASYKNLNVEQINIMKSDEELVDQSKFDGFLQKFLQSDNATFLVDTGSGEFLPLNNYLVIMDIPSIIQEFGKNIYIHVPISYGQAEQDSIKCLVKIAENYPNTPIIVWENEYFGKPVNDFIKTKAYQSIKNIIGVVKISKLNTDTFEKDFSTMLKNSMTFDDVKTDEKVFQFFSKTRLHRIEQDINTQIDAVFNQA
ncbi:hypothetical protein [Moraxella equi]|uniref:Conjugal transfer protein TraL n=1 Tax=Moraxella equi TaxID=60442 RepID=A0A378UT87_9GAMM|nr:hypothetical protein [Moraxella equi]OPH37668.1 hypothetical protein B5J93_08075 [Moraxella equi]STZ82930.1 conjugal transfer protein TraL [Moraxella equi]